MINDNVTRKMACFVVTPIGGDESAIRRHIDGIIDQSICPAIGDKFNIKVAHREYETGSINDRVIRSVYESDLVIANLTGLNPNVMFELALRYSFGKPVIVIAEKGTILPFDIIEQNTIFYINDPSGACELKNNIKKFEQQINYDSQEYGPVFKAVQQAPLYNAIESEEKISNEKISNDNLIKYIIDRLDNIESMVANEKAHHMSTTYKEHIMEIERPENIPTDKLVEIQLYLLEKYSGISFLFDERTVRLAGNDRKKVAKAREEFDRLI